MKRFLLLITTLLSMALATAQNQSCIRNYSLYSSQTVHLETIRPPYGLYLYRLPDIQGGKTYRRKLLKQ
ncbi:hypothetical protein FK220_004420 [Flavobacteriaceae bacterium TP-CH-4]|uniref:Uncharacterized protein n=1 Tax=Pelagihabitans pacificus TaxID=2696054 RepID=A0A967AQZ1_9FLAO|nr:hypothetical protein [Pelagihabitans pacificus]NHF58569.1 hypothetical protein [Pelagihabitans pacificus]